MFQQYERVPKHYVLDAQQETGSKTPSLALVSAGRNDGEICHFGFEALRPNVFRTTFTTSKHVLPIHPSANRPEPTFGSINPEVNIDAERHSQTIKIGDTKIDIDWSNTPVISLFLDGQSKPIHRDLDFRSYAIDGTGVSHYLTYKTDSLYVGLGEKAAPMNLSGRGFSITASDTFGYDAYRTDPLYKHIPLLIKVTPEGCVGIFSTSHARSTWAIGSELDGMWGHFKVYRQAHGGLEEYIIVGKTVAEIVRSYAELVGFPLLVPRYMMGYVGGGMKYSMEDSPRACDSILNFIKNAELHGMPCSAFQMSSGYTVAETVPKTRNVFTWNRHRFPDPREFTRECHKHGVRLLANVKPYVLANHPAYTELSRIGAFFKDPDTKTTAVTRLWSAGGGESGEGSHLDFTSKAGYNWWYNGVKDLKKVGIDVMWNDNNEYNIPNDSWECALETVDIPPGETRNHIGLWGRALNTELNGKSSHDATLESEPGVRPFVLTRSATAGTMRYCASSWSGDNVTSWEGMKGANSLALNAGFSLIQCYGHDIGGFEGPQPTPELLVRWIQLGVHSPRFAINCYKTNPDDNLIGEVIEPWQYPSVEPIIRNTIKRRYELVPYTYAGILRSHREAIPPQRWTGWGYESDPEVWSKKILQGDTQYWFGDSLLISGVYEPGVSSARVYLPKRNDDDPGYLNLSAPYQYLEAGKWHEISSEWYTSIPVIARIGSAVPIGKSKPTTCIADEDPEFPGMEKDNYRGVEIFPPAIVRYPHCPTGYGNEHLKIENSTVRTETQWFHYSWLEDDGVSLAEKADACEVSIAYGVSSNEIRVKVELLKEGKFEPLWLKNDITVVLPVGEERVVRLEDGGDTDLEDLGRDEKGRHIWKVRVEVKVYRAVIAMDEFAQLARETFEGSQRYGDSSLGPNAEHRAITVNLFPATPARYDENFIKIENLGAFFRNGPRSSDGSISSGSTTPVGEKPLASLKLVTLDSRLETWSNYYPSLWVAKHVFLDLIDAMGMNPAALWLLRNEYDGFHYFPSTSSPADTGYPVFYEDEYKREKKEDIEEQAEKDEEKEKEKEEEEEEEEGEEKKGLDTYYIGTSSFVLVWTFDPKRLQTYALWILRWRAPVEDMIPAPDMPMAWFLHVLRRHCGHVRSPFLLGYVAALSACCNSDLDNSYRAHAVRLMERDTGYHDTISGGIVERMGMVRISGFIKETGEVLNHITNNQRHFRFLDSVLNFIVENAVIGIEEQWGEDSTQKLAAAIPSLKRRMHASQEYLGYLKERAERLSAVLFTLLTHEDSATHAELADASRRIAEASKRDSSSMKTVAVMTMAFLPATFIAALFSVPSLDWQATNGPVIQNNFWVYWAFTLPATAIVFGLWVLLDNRTTGDGDNDDRGHRGKARVTEDEERPRTARSKLG
ncbi:glycoside hydrolase family 31 protein [Hypoxylon trugodes]|uniref:glycoside hydrolase family 31 protein n=1 Tax=Hypoxylon trugodes TaxID=326681 RepID=UPI002192C2E9|nr:glycoside hydrolase family 31 protein [Hypoxylon trugodes]KAI1385579.1 glycoside hydrolase family 31 protein [Hypoxylon trugodes]